MKPEPASTSSWALTRYGKAMDLISPDPAMIDFAEIADTLAHVYRWTGAARYDISVAWHTLICLDIAIYRDVKGLIPYVLLHDAHEAYIGDITTPVARALEWASGDNGISHLKRTFDHAIHNAASLGPASLALQYAVRSVDLTALMTERRDYLPNLPRRWPDNLEKIQPFHKAYGAPPPPGVCAERLLAAFKQHLPVFTGQQV